MGLRAVSIFAAVFALTGCQTDGTTKVSVNDGSTAYLSKSDSIPLTEAWFNVPVVFPSVVSAEARDRDNGTGRMENFYNAEGKLVVAVQYARDAWFNERTRSQFENEQILHNLIAKSGGLFGKGSNIIKVKEGDLRAFYVRTENCVAFKSLSRSKGGTPYDNDKGFADTLMEGLLCDEFKDDFLRELGRMRPEDVAFIASRERSQNATPEPERKSRPASSDGGWNVRPIAVEWEGHSDLIVGELMFRQNAGTGHMKFSLPDGGGTCEGSYRVGRDGNGTWAVACPEGLAASGTLKTRGPGKGSAGSGVDTKGRKVRYTLGGA